MKKPIAEILIPERRRDDLGDLASLAKSIETYGLIHPIVVDETGTLVAGERRLEACKRLGWTEVEVRAYGELTAKERQAIELEENIKRKNLTTEEYHKNMRRQRQQARVVITENKAAAPEFLSTVNKNSKGGRPRKDASQAEISNTLGVSQSTISRNEHYTTTLEKYPDLAGIGIPMKTAIVMGKALDSLPDEIREQKLQDLHEGEPGILADLAGLPPMPPPNHDGIDHQKQWSAGLKHLRQAVQELTDTETITAMQEKWTPEIAKNQYDLLMNLLDRLDAAAVSLKP